MSSREYEKTHTGATVYNQRNYNTADYTYKNMKTLAQGQVRAGMMLQLMKIAKIKCLKEAQRETDTPILAIQRDEEYLPEFTACVKNEFLSASNREKAEENDELMDKTIDCLIDTVKLEEVKEIDWRVWKNYNEEYKEKWRGVNE